MSWRDQLAKLVTGERAVIVHDAIPELQKAWAGFAERAWLMRQHAEQAPNQLSREELSRLADEDDLRGQQIAKALAGLGGVPREFEQPSVDTALNHWTRLVQDLEAHRVAMRHFREEGIHFAERLPATAKLFDELCTHEEAHGVRLRDLIARTDPQAIN